MACLEFLGSRYASVAAVGAKTRKIEIGTAVIDMRYENPHYMAEDAGAAESNLWRPTAVGNQPRFPRAGHRWLALFWLPPE
jgi:hypothetical protein